MLTILRNKDTNREDFIFFIDRLATLVVEKATEHLPYTSRTVITPLDVPSHGKKLDTAVSCRHLSALLSESHVTAEYVCGVSILRSYGSF
jgi:uridine kinase